VLALDRAAFGASRASALGALARLAARGVVPAGPDPLMSYLGRPLPGDRDQLYGLFMQAAG
jgi:hypothetical protein